MGLPYSFFLSLFQASVLLVFSEYCLLVSHQLERASLSKHVSMLMRMSFLCEILSDIFPMNFSILQADLNLAALDGR